VDYLNWELEVLSKAVSFGNLTGASSHVGLSQPQLSRIVSKLEQKYQVVLLDRDAKRKASWTPAANRLAEIYVRMSRQFQGEIHLMIEGNEVKHLRIGALEGLSAHAAQCASHILSKTSVSLLELHVYDLSELEEKFMKRDVDIVFTSRVPGRKKYQFEKSLGYQTIDIQTGGPVAGEHYRIFSSYQYSPQVKQEVELDSEAKVFVSNSLFVRQSWLENYGGRAIVPSKVSLEKRHKKTEESVLMIAHDHFAKSFWEQISSFQIKI
jgi:LysR family transcriptional regulator, transcriptional activator for aaeXAB operon